MIEFLYAKIGLGPICALVNDLYSHMHIPLRSGTSDRFLLWKTVSEVFTTPGRSDM
jgi:hypothetical protein